MIRRAPLRGDELPAIVVPPPGPRSRAAARRLRRAEGAAIWGSDASPIVWKRARGSVVEDLDGNRYVDLTGGFGVAALGHAAPEVRRAVAAQAGKLIQGLGDLHPHETREKLARRVASLGGPLSKALLASTGSEAVELALQTAALATGRRRFVAFEGGYHGQSGVALEATHFPPSSPLLLPAGPARAMHIPYPDPRRCAARRGCSACDLACLEEGWRRVERECDGPDPPGAVIVEPIQGRAGVIVPPPAFLPRLSALARARGMLVILDEIMTGAGRTGPFWAWERCGATAEPDLLTAGKALGGGVAIAALLGKPAIMEAWAKHAPASGEAPYASTFYAHPLACAGALAAIERLAAPGTRAEVERKGALLEETLRAAATPGWEVRAAGLMAAVAAPGRPGAGVALASRLLGRGVLAIPGGLDGTCASMLPAYTMGDGQIRDAAERIGVALGDGSTRGSEAV
ncbi:MAG TPA: aspartate aminotransferase family protein [Candidatus Eisenbacteria bacterium]